jgi:hypothetical protein
MQSAVMAGLKVVPVKTHADGNLDLEDLKAKAEKHQDKLAAFMVRISKLQAFQMLDFSKNARSLILPRLAYSRKVSRR